MLLMIMDESTRAMISQDTHSFLSFVASTENIVWSLFIIFIIVFFYRISRGGMVSSSLHKLAFGSPEGNCSTELCMVGRTKAFAGISIAIVRTYIL
ncbi:hypothetical protein P152DRAFT_107838 [Eremomyces bilateralis CBS 781.70]|uniref:Uncharacterized protein n=1 Tax=Eremomyces bilateralis CBS 781.70 TaxID=1392243 RepID=A0A6G1GDC7_9PEZI|nr:uncharacterized protein P152DRAFT_107838 [Eremomyces bilateralis CBS 781.70]KAF1816024.1 hypothetical protein P152DRAFT_107838 [Eremomyces bilateralis CBS 781.70]